MTKGKIALGLVIISTICIIATLFLNNHNNVIIENEDSNQIINTNALTMMYETEAGSGEYQVSNDTTWPQDGYVFNETLSKCENGSTLTWDDENKKVLLQTSKSDKCYVYFDILGECTDFLEVGTQLTTVAFDCHVDSSGMPSCTPTYRTDNFPWLSHYGGSYYLELTVNDVESTISLYYYEMGTYSENYGAEYCLYNDYYCRESASAGAGRYYSYHFSMKNNYCDLCVNGLTRKIEDCNETDWWKKTS